MATMQCVQVATPIIYSQMKNEIAQRESGGWHRIEWSLVQRPTLRDVQLLQARLIGDPQNEIMCFAQLTVLFPSMQSFAAYGRNGKLLAGDPDKKIKVEDIWVFERSLNKDNLAARWRLAARLSLPK